MDKMLWIDLFVMRLSWHDFPHSLRKMRRLAEALYADWGNCDPLVIADVEYSGSKSNAN